MHLEEDTPLEVSPSLDHSLPLGEIGTKPPKKKWKDTSTGKRWAGRVRRGLIIGEFVEEEKELPRDLRNVVVKRSKKDALGSMSLQRFTGVKKNKTAKVIRKFERELTGGKDDIIEKMEALEGRGELNKEQVSILDQLRKKPNITLERAIVEAGARPLAVMDAYAKGCVALSKMQALIVAHQGLPSVVRDLFRHAIDGSHVCDVCVGAGRVPLRPGANVLSQNCPRCLGKGEVFATSSEHKEFAVQKILEVTKMTEKHGPTVNVNTNVGVKVGGGGGVLERMSLLADEVLYGKRETPIDAEVIGKREASPSPSDVLV